MYFHNIIDSLRGIVDGPREEDGPVPGVDDEDEEGPVDRELVLGLEEGVEGDGHAGRARGLNAVLVD